METLDIGSENKAKKRISLRQCMELYPRDFRVIQKIAEDTLGEYYEALKEFYSSILQSSEYQYIVFVARRSIGLAELFFIILWNEAEDEWEKWQLEESWARATTDSTILSYSSQIAREIENGLHPKILIVDDVLIQGNGLNELLSGIEQSVLMELHNSIDSISAQERWIDVVNTINIRIFAQNEKLSVVNLQYQLKLKPQFKMSPRKWHDLSRKISNMILATGMANATFIMGAEVTPKTPQNLNSIHRIITDGLHLDSTTCLKTIPYKVGTLFERYYLGWSGGLSNKVKYYCSLRIIKNCYTNCFRIMPFVFLPQLTENSYDRLKEKIFDKWNLSKENTVLYPGKNTSRLEYEAMVLHLSESLLASWLNAANIKLRQNDFDPSKVVLNYTLNRCQPMMDADEFLRLMDSNYLFSWDELIELLDEVTADAEVLSITTRNTTLDSRRPLEDLVYNMKIQELTESYRSYSYLPPMERHTVIPTLTENRKTNWNISLGKFISQAAEWISHINLDRLFCNILSFMDEGIITLKARRSESRFIQVLRMGEQSLFIWPERYEIYLPMLSHIVEHAEHSFGDPQEYVLSFLQYAQNIGELDSDIKVETLTEELICYLNSLRDSGQQLEDWDIDFDSPAVLDGENRQWVKWIGSYYFDNQIESMIRASKKRSLFNACLEFYPN